MPLPAAVPPAPIAVLVLAWDEATPAVRALVEATQASVPPVDSLLVMVPRADSPEGLSAEEYLPLPLVPAALSAELPGPEPQPLPAEAEPLQATLQVTEPEAALPGAAVAETSPDPLRLPAAATPLTAASESVPLTWATVRVVRLGSLSLPQLAIRAGQPLPAPAWTGSATPPAVPYVGAAGPGESSAVVSNLSNKVANNAPASPVLPPPTPTVAVPTVTVPFLTTSLPSAAAQATTLPTSTRQAPPLYNVTDSIAQAPEPEADLTPREANELAGFDSSVAHALPTDDYLFNAEGTPVQADWSAALATLRQPATLPEAAPTVEPANEPDSAAHPALRPAAQHYPAPDLNFQIIQYARFVVPVALAEPPFAVLYAPAWPTWLAAQELRQRTGRPLVLHVATLAAADDESVETATGWIAELQRQALRRADLIIAETPALAQRLRRELELEPSRVLAIPAAEAAAVAQALRAAQPRPAAT